MELQYLNPNLPSAGSELAEDFSGLYVTEDGGNVAKQLQVYGGGAIESVTIVSANFMYNDTTPDSGQLYAKGSQAVYKLNNGSTTDITINNLPKYLTKWEYKKSDESWGDLPSSFSDELIAIAQSNNNNIDVRGIWESPKFIRVIVVSEPNLASNLSATVSLTSNSSYTGDYPLTNGFKKVVEKWPQGGSRQTNFNGPYYHGEYGVNDGATGTGGCPVTESGVTYTSYYCVKGGDSVQLTVKNITNGYTISKNTNNQNIASYHNFLCREDPGKSANEVVLTYSNGVFTSQSVTVTTDITFYVELVMDSSIQYTITYYKEAPNT